MPSLPELPIPPSWFPGHMRRFTRILPPLLHKTNVVLEVRDTRLPLTSINHQLEGALRTWRLQHGWDPADPSRRIVDTTACERIVVFSKRDLVPEWGLRPFQRAMANRFPGQRHVFASGQRPSDIRNLRNMLEDLAKKYPYATEMNVLCIGMPNVGKSTLLNALRGAGIAGQTAKAFRTSGNPGLTQTLSMRVRLSRSLPIYAYDSPGVMLPFLGHGPEGAERGVRLALIAGIKEGLYDFEALAAYLLYHLNVLNPEAPAYLSILPPGTLPVAELETFLDILAQRMGMVGKGGVLDRSRAAVFFVRWWRGEGNLLASDSSFEAAPSSALRIASPDASGSLLSAPNALVQPKAGSLVPGASRPRATLAPLGWGLDLEWSLTAEERQRPLSPTAMEAKMGQCIDRHLAQMAEEEASENNVSVNQRRKAVIEERKAKIAEKAKMMTKKIRRAEERKRAARR
ncbi:Mitochondrial GTPase [Mycena kentingensis (nom. inval.)]|nr:Mitochondrial GTPase [Mycena kentingensis (nom. inval.)]